MRPDAPGKPAPPNPPLWPPCPVPPDAAVDGEPDGAVPVLFPPPEPEPLPQAPSSTTSGTSARADAARSRCRPSPAGADAGGWSTVVTVIVFAPESVGAPGRRCREAYGRSFAAQRVDGCQPGRTAGRIHAEQEPDPKRHSDRADDRGDGQRDRVRDERRQHLGAGYAHPGPEQAASEPEQRRLEQELPADQPWPGAECLAQPDLAD